MDIKRIFISIMFGAVLGGILGAVGGMIGGIYSRFNDPLTKLVQFESTIQRLHFLWDGIASNLILATLVGIVTGVLVNVFAMIISTLWNVILVITITFLFAGWVMFSVGESIVGEPGGMIGGGLFGILGGFIGRYLINKYLLG